MDVPTVRRLESMGLAPKDWPDRTSRRRAMAWGNRLYLARSGRWLEPAWAATLARTGWSWGVCAADFDNDGDLDVAVANGHVSGASAADYDSQYWTHDIYLGGSGDADSLRGYLGSRLAGLNAGRTSWNGYQHDAFFLDLGGHDYVNVAFLMGVAHETDCRALASADLDEDGKPDLLVTEALWQGTPHRMRHRLLVHLNRLNAGNHWIGARLASTSPGVPLIGAKVFARSKDHTSVAQIIASDSFQTQHPATVHFGLGAATQVAELKVVWPDGKTSVLTDPAVDRYHQVSR
jgi:hypothetical protein